MTIKYIEVMYSGCVNLEADYSIDSAAGKFGFCNLMYIQYFTLKLYIYIN